MQNPREYHKEAEGAPSLFLSLSLTRLSHLLALLLRSSFIEPGDYVEWPSTSDVGYGDLYAIFRLKRASTQRQFYVPHYF